MALLQVSAFHRPQVEPVQSRRRSLKERPLSLQGTQWHRPGEPGRMMGLGSLLKALPRCHQAAVPGPAQQQLLPFGAKRLTGERLPGGRGSVRACGRFSDARQPVGGGRGRDSLEQAKLEDQSASSSAEAPSDTGITVELTLPDPIPEKWKDLSEAEILRRMRISQANRGKKAWNTGRKHSEATKEKIRQRTREAMKRPEVIGKLKAMKHPKHNAEIKEKIRQSLKQFHDQRGRKHPELTEEEKEARRQRARERRSEAMKRRNAEKRAAGAAAAAAAAASGGVVDERIEAARSEAHRLKISMAIKKKWADPEYRIKMTKSLSGSTSARAASRREETLLRRKDELLAEKREQMRANAKELVAKASATVEKLEQQMDALQGNPMLEMKAQGALENARGVLKKAQARVAKVEMEIVMAANAAMDSWDQVRDGDLGLESSSPDGEGEGSPPSSASASYAGQGPDLPLPPSTRSIGSVSSASLGADIAANGQSLKVNGSKHLKVNGHGSSEQQQRPPLKTNGSHLKVNGSHGTSSVPAEPLVDGQLMKAFVEGGVDALRSLDESMDSDDEDLEDEAPQGQARRRPNGGGTLFGSSQDKDEDPDAPAEDRKVWRNGRLVSFQEPTDHQPEP